MKLENFNEAQRLVDQRATVLNRLEQWGKQQYDDEPLLAGLLVIDRLPALDNDAAMCVAILKAIRVEYEDRLRRIEGDLQLLGVELEPSPTQYPPLTRG